VLLPAGLKHQTHHGNAARIPAKVIAECANGPVAPGAG
jgi:glutamate dehydrogenase (NAD(P)+)